jgi:hypothetical protein
MSDVFRMKVSKKYVFTEKKICFLSFLDPSHFLLKMVSPLVQLKKISVARSDLNYRPVIHSSNSNLLEVDCGSTLKSTSRRWHFQEVLDESFQQRGETLPPQLTFTAKKTLFAYSLIANKKVAAPLAPT